MIKAPWILPDSKNLFWTMFGFCVLMMTITICYLLLSGKVGAFQANSNGFSIDLTKTEVALKLVNDNEDNLQIIQGLLERERWHKKKIERLEEQVKSSIALPFISKPTGPELSKEVPKVQLDGKSIESDRLDEVLASKTIEVKETKLRLELQKEIHGRMNQQQFQQVPQQQQQVGAR